MNYVLQHNPYILQRSLYPHVHSLPAYHFPQRILIYPSSPPLPLPPPPPPPRRLSLLPRSCHYGGPYFHIDPMFPDGIFYKWAKPIGAFCTLNTDGSVARRRSGIGGIIRDSRSIPIVAFADRCPKMPVHLVELWGIRRGLRLALLHGVRHINVDADCSEAVKYIYMPPSACRDLLVRKCVSDIQSLLKCFASWNCKHVFRETNAAADYLSRLARNDDLLLNPSHFPEELRHIVDQDAKGRYYLREKSVGIR